MSDLDRYDVEAMIRDALHTLNVPQLERDIARLKQELRDMHTKLEDEIQSLERVLHSRTEHLV